MTTEEKALAVRAAIGVYARAVEDVKRAIEDATGEEPGINAAIHQIPLSVFASLNVEHEDVVRTERGFVPFGRVAGVDVFAAPLAAYPVTAQTWRAAAGLADESQAVAS